MTKSPPFTHSIPLLRSLHWLPVRFRILFQINLFTYKTLREKQPVYLRSMLAAWIPSRSLRSNNDNSLSVPRVKTNIGARAFTLVPRLFGTTSLCLSIQPVQLLPSRNIWRQISLIWPSPHRYRHSPWPVDVTELFPRFAVEHWFACRATEPGFAGDIGAIEVWLIILEGGLNLEGVLRRGSTIQACHATS